MKVLEDKIRAYGRTLNEDVLLVDMFLNHQVDCELMREIGSEFARLFSKESIDRVVTIEASGIAPALMTALELRVPLVVLKKSASVINQGALQTEVFSFTKQKSYLLTLKSEYLPAGERVLLIDDFLANGEAALGAARLIEEAGGIVASIGIVISKNYMPGLQRLRDAGYKVSSLAQIGAMSEGFVRFVGEED